MDHHEQQDAELIEDMDLMVQYVVSFLQTLGIGIAFVLAWAVLFYIVLR